MLKQKTQSQEVFKKYTDISYNGVLCWELYKRVELIVIDYMNF
jgi:hypothetical protein